MRATNWVGDAVMSLAALRALRRAWPRAHIAVLARSWVADIYGREAFADEVIPYDFRPGARDLAAKCRAARRLAGHQFDCAILFQNAFEAAMVAALARIPRRIGYNRDGRGWLLTDAIAVPRAGETPPHQSYYYLELLKRSGMIDGLPEPVEIRLEAAGEARGCGLRRFLEMGLGEAVVGVSPGAAYGGAKRWPTERFTDAAVQLSRVLDASVAVFGSAQERGLAGQVVAGLTSAGVRAENLAGRTRLREFIDLTAACRVFLTNDSGAMHIASALRVPTVAVFGATDHIATGPLGETSRVVREPVDCSPCLLRECPIDHRCMTRVSAARVAETALELLK